MWLCPVPCCVQFQEPFIVSTLIQSDVSQSSRYPGEMHSLCGENGKENPSRPQKPLTKTCSWRTKTKTTDLCLTTALDWVGSVPTVVIRDWNFFTICPLASGVWKGKGFVVADMIFVTSGTAVCFTLILRYRRSIRYAKSFVFTWNSKYELRLLIVSNHGCPNEMYLVFYQLEMSVSTQCNQKIFLQTQSYEAPQPRSQGQFWRGWKHHSCEVLLADRTLLSSLEDKSTVSQCVQKLESSNRTI